MSLSQALLASAAGLRVTQAGLALVSSNVANAETPGYARKVLAPVATAGSGVQVGAVNRALDIYVQRQFRIELAGASYADMRARFYDRLQLSFGEPGAAGTLETAFSDFTAALQALTTMPESYSTRSNVLSTAQILAQQLNRMSADVQGLRLDAEHGLAESVTLANEAMRQIARINQQLAASPTRDAATAVLMDQRDRYVDQLAELMDVRVLPGDNDQVTVFTNSGVQLVGATAAELRFEPQGMMVAGAQWSADPAARAVGTIELVSPSGDSIDLIANNSIRSGRIAAYIEMRDRTLVQAQTQLDAIAAAMAQALSDQATPGAAVSAGPQNGFEVDLAGLLAGNSVRVTYTDIASGEQRVVTFVRVDDPAALPLSDDATADPADRVVGIDFAGGMASIVAQVASELGVDFTVSNPSGSVLRILDDGGVDVAMGAMSATRTATGLTDGQVELPFFLDGTAAYTGAITSGGSQFQGFAGRIRVNAALLADPSKLVVYSAAPATAAGDTTRPSFILDQLTQAKMLFPPQSGIGSAAAPFEASLSGFLRQVVSQQGADAAAAASLKQGQDMVVGALGQRMAEASGVSIDQEMAHLLQLQTAYAANARVMSAVKEMMELLTRL